MTEDGQVVDGDDERHPRRDGGAEGRAVQNVHAGGGVAEAERIPERVPPHGCEPSGAARRETDELEPWPSLQGTQEAEDVAGRPGPRLDERIRVDSDLHDRDALRTASRGSG